MRRLIPFLCLLIPFVTFSCSWGKGAASKQEDSLLKRLAFLQFQHTEDSGMVKVLAELARCYSQTTPARAMEYASKSLAISKKIHWAHGIANGNIILGIISDLQGNSTNALGYYFAALKISDEACDTETSAVVYVNIGTVYQEQHDLEKAWQYYQKALKLEGKAGYQDNIASAIGNMGALYAERRKYDSALFCFFKALKIFEDLGNKNSTALIMEGICEAYSATQQYNKALTYGLTALKIAEETNSQHSECAILTGLARVYLAVAAGSDGKQSEEHVQINVAPTGNKQDKPFLHDGLIPNGKQANLNIALNYLQEAMEIAKRLRATDVLYHIYENQCKAFKLAGSYQMALAANDSATSIKDSLFSAESKIAVSNLETKREHELKDKQIEIDKLEIEKKNNERVFYLSGILLLLILFGVMFRSFNVQKRLNKTITTLANEQEQTLQVRTGELAESNRKLAVTNNRLIALIKYNAHNLREPLTRISGAMMIRDYMASEEFYREVWPQMQTAVTELDNNLKDVIKMADDAVGKYDVKI